MNIAPPTDDNPFYFHMLRLRDAMSVVTKRSEDPNVAAVGVLGLLLLVTILFTVVCIFIPLLFTTKRETLAGSGPLLTYFAAIGLGFLMIEISQMQRLSVFLGHPIYSLSVVLFSLLVSSGIGSWSTRRIEPAAGIRSSLARMVLLLLVLAVFGIATPPLVARFAGSTTPVRIAVAVAILLPIGYFMGMAFPLGMKLAAGRSPRLLPWLWGTNGSTSVCASVLAIAIALTGGIATSFWSGLACYVLALAVFTRAHAAAPAASRSPAAPATPAAPVAPVAPAA